MIRNRQKTRSAAAPSGRPTAGDGGRQPTRAIVILLDSLNRHLLGAYGGAEFTTPNLDRLARRALRFTRHYAGSLPCMPARHDLLCGALDFLWKPWGSVEIWERPLTVYLRRAGVVTQLVTDHPHLFETGGENYHTDFTAWDYQRGHESDPWRTRPDPSWIGAPSFSRGHTPYDNSRGYFRSEADFPGPRTMAAAARWLDEDAAAHERFLLFIDEFDPHEPFDTPEPYASLYDPGWRAPHLIWPPYLRGALANGVLSPAEARQVRACYGAKLTMIDTWLGRVLDVVDRRGLWDTTAVVLCTDHGHYLGEKDIWGKPPVPVFEPLGHIPLLVAWPGAAPRTVDALTTSVDIAATIADLFGIAFEHRTHGRSLLPIIRGESAAVREWLLVGSVGTRGAGGHRWAQVCACPTGQERAAQPVVEPLVHHARAQPARAAPAAAGRSRRTRPHARELGARAAPAVPRRRRVAAVGVGGVQRQSPLSPGR